MSKEFPSPCGWAEAYLELGCIYRDWARLRPRYEHDKDLSPAQLVAQSETALREAAKSAKSISYRQVDALVNLAWLYYYAGDLESVSQTIQGALSVIPSEYAITPDQGVPDRDKPVAFFWVQMGKTALLRGVMAFDRYAADKKAEDLEMAVQEYTLSLAYNEMFSADFRDLRRAKEQIYARLKKLNIDEQRIVQTGIEKTAEQYQLGSPRIVNFIEENFGPLTAMGGDVT